MNFSKQKYKVKELSIFGSYVKGKQKESSDIDILVEFAEPVSLLQSKRRCQGKN